MLGATCTSSFFTVFFNDMLLYLTPTIVWLTFRKILVNIYPKKVAGRRVRLGSMDGNGLCGSFLMDIASKSAVLRFAKATLAKHVSKQ